jgi:rhodanese-related sulfurtransferase
MTSDEIIKKSESIQIVDARTKNDYEEKGCVEGAVNIPHAELRNRITELDENTPTVTYCNKGTTGNAAQNILLNRGFKEVYNLSGGHTFYKATEK